MASELVVEEWQSDPTLDSAREELWRAMWDWTRNGKGANTTLPQFYAYARAAYNLGLAAGKAGNQGSAAEE